MRRLANAIALDVPVGVQHVRVDARGRSTDGRANRLQGGGFVSAACAGGKKGRKLMPIQRQS